MQSSRLNSAKQNGKANNYSQWNQGNSDDLEGHHYSTDKNIDQDSVRSRPNSSKKKGSVVRSQSDNGWSMKSGSRPNSGSDRYSVPSSKPGSASGSRRSSQTSYDGSLPMLPSPNKPGLVGNQTKEGQRPKSVHYKNQCSEVNMVLHGPCCLDPSCCCFIIDSILFFHICFHLLRCPTSLHIFIFI